MDYVAHNFIQEENFTRVEVDLASRKLRARVFNTQGTLSGSSGFDFYLA